MRLPSTGGIDDIHNFHQNRPRDEREPRITVEEEEEEEGAWVCKYKECFYFMRYGSSRKLSQEKEKLSS